MSLTYILQETFWFFANNSIPLLQSSTIPFFISGFAAWSTTNFKLEIKRNKVKHFFNLDGKYNAEDSWFVCGVTIFRRAAKQLLVLGRVVQSPTKLTQG